MVRLVVQLLVMVTRYGFSVFEFGGEVRGWVGLMRWSLSICVQYIYIYIYRVCRYVYKLGLIGCV